MIFLTPLGGAFADRFPRRRLLLCTQLGMLLQALVLAGLTLSGQIQLWHIFVLSAANSVLLALDNPTRQALLPDLVRPEQLQSAVSLQSVVWSGSALFGPALGGLLLVPLNPGGLFLVNAVSYLAVLFALVALRGVPDQPHGVPDAVLPGVLNGLRYASRDGLTRTVLLLLVLVSLFGRSYQTLMPIFARDVLHVGPEGYGLLLAAPGAGAILGGFGLAAVRTPATTAPGPARRADGIQRAGGAVHGIPELPAGPGLAARRRRQQHRLHGDGFDPAAAAFAARIARASDESGHGRQYRHVADGRTAGGRGGDRSRRTGRGGRGSRRGASARPARCRWSGLARDRGWRDASGSRLVRANDAALLEPNPPARVAQTEPDALGQHAEKATRSGTAQCCTARHDRRPTTSVSCSRGRAPRGAMRHPPFLHQLPASPSPGCGAPESSSGQHEPGSGCSRSTTGAATGTEARPRNVAAPAARAGPRAPRSRTVTLHSTASSSSDCSKPPAKRRSAIAGSTRRSLHGGHAQYDPVQYVALRLYRRQSRSSCGPSGDSIRPHGSSRHVDFHIRVGAVPRAEHSERPPLAISLVLDRSGSMHGDKIVTARRAAIAVLEHLDERDRVAAVVFDDHIDVLQESTPVTPDARARLRAQLLAVEARGRTALHEGWLTGCQAITSATPEVGPTGAQPSCSRTGWRTLA